jgi:O-antigen/teichoic acid export membrane protein
MFRKLAKDAGIYSILGILRPFLALFMYPFLTRWVSSSELGAAELAIMISMYLHIILSFSLGQGLARKWCEQKSDEDRQVLFSTVITYISVSFSIIILCSIFFSNILSRVIFGSGINHVKVLIVIMATYAMFDAVVFVMSLLARFDLRAKDYAKSMACGAITSACATFLFIIFLGGNAVSMILGQLCGVVVSGLVLLPSSKTYYKYRFSRVLLRSLISYSVPLSLVTLTANLSGNIDRLLVGKIVGLAELGVYNAGAKIAAMGGIILSGLQMGLLPLVFSTYTQKDGSQNIAKVAVFVISGYTCVWLLLSLGMNWAMVILFDAEFWCAADIACILLWIPMLSSMSTLFPGLLIENRTWMLFSYTLFGLIISSLGCYYFTTFNSANGVALAVLSGSILSALFLVWDGLRHYNVPVDWKMLIRGWLIAVTGFLFGRYFFPMSFDNPWDMQLVKRILTAVMVIFLLLLNFRRFLSGIFNAK